MSGVDESVKSLQAAKSALEVATDQELRVPYYCEENVWRLAFRKLHRAVPASQDDTQSSFFVVFVSNQKKCVQMFQQRASGMLGKPCYWDYHVILLETSRQQKGEGSVGVKAMSTIHDIDSMVPFPCSLESYLEHSFPSEYSIYKDVQPLFRVVDAACFLNNFSSDRMHMYDPETEQWSAKQPFYDTIQPHGHPSNLMKYVDTTMTEAKENDSVNFGSVYTLDQLKARFLS